MTARPHASSTVNSATRGERVDHAIAELKQLRSSDPAARSAVHAIKLTRLTLETFWHHSDDAPKDPVA